MTAYAGVLDSLKRLKLEPDTLLSGGESMSRNHLQTGGEIMLFAKLTAVDSSASPALRTAAAGLLLALMVAVQPALAQAGDSRCSRHPPCRPAP